VGEYRKMGHAAILGCVALLLSLGGCANPGITAQLDPPAISPGGGTYTSARTVQITTRESGASIRYTTDGTNPSGTAGQVYTGPVSISSSMTLKAVVSKSGWLDSSVNFATYTIMSRVADPILSVAAGTFVTGQSISLSTTTGGANIQYTTNNTTPSRTSGTSYSNPIAITTDTTLKAIGYETGMNDSNVISAFYGFRPFNWTPGSGTGPQTWSSITSSINGNKLAAGTIGGDIWTSADYGATWTDRTGPGARIWTSIASSQGGGHLAATTNGGDIWTSADSGATWTDRTTSGPHSWTSIASSTNGSNLCAAVAFGHIWTSADSGATWTDQAVAGTRNWSSIDSSSNGAIIIACENGGQIWVSTDTGLSWTLQAPSTGSWVSVACSTDGSHFAAADATGYIWTSSNSGGTWTRQTGSGSRTWASIAMSADGMQIAAAANFGDIYTSRDGGATWVDQATAGSPGWRSIASSSDGTRLAAVAASPSILIGQ